MRRGSSAGSAWVSAGEFLARAAGSRQRALPTSRRPPMAEPEDKNEKGEGSCSFWVTAPGLITAVGGLLTAIAV